MTPVTYTYDSLTGGNYGISRRTGMGDSSGSSAYLYDARGRLVEESKTIDAVVYTTAYAYDGADRVTDTTYPTGEVVATEYNDRGLPDTLSGTVSGDLVIPPS